jgi:hypothetical protein
MHFVSKEKIKKNSILNKVFDLIVKDTGFDPNQDK